MFLMYAVPAYADAFVYAGHLNQARQYPGLALLPGGKVLAVSGHPVDGKSIDSAEIYDPAIDEWLPTGSLRRTQGGVEPGGLTMLPNGKVLIAGGGYQTGSRKRSELFDPTSGSWEFTGSMTYGRSTHTTTSLGDGRVLVTGGIDWSTNVVHASAEIYDFEEGTWLTAGEMHTPRMNHSAVGLDGDRVLIMGGATADPSPGKVVSNCEIFDATHRKFNQTASMAVARRSFPTAVLATGNVLVIGGTSGAAEGNRALSECEVYDPVTGEWSRTGSLLHARWGSTATMLSDGRVLVTGGIDGNNGSFRRLASTELYDSKTGQWCEGPPLHEARNGHRAIELTDRRVLIVGGYSGTDFLSTCEIFTP